VHESLVGTFRKWCCRCAKSVDEGKADVNFKEPKGLVSRICIRPLHGAFVLPTIMDIRGHPISFSERPWPLDANDVSDCSGCLMRQASDVLLVLPRSELAAAARGFLTISPPHLTIAASRTRCHGLIVLWCDGLGAACQDCSRRSGFASSLINFSIQPSLASEGSDTGSNPNRL
jgi:hypothetical protein